MTPIILFFLILPIKSFCKDQAMYKYSSFLFYCLVCTFLVWRNFALVLEECHKMACVIIKKGCIIKHCASSALLCCNYWSIKSGVILLGLSNSGPRGKQMSSLSVRIHKSPRAVKAFIYIDWIKYIRVDLNTFLQYKSVFFWKTYMLQFRLFYIFTCTQKIYNSYKSTGCDWNKDQLMLR